MTVPKTGAANSNTAADPASAGNDTDAQAALNAIVASREAPKGAETGETDAAGTDAPAGATATQTVAQVEGKIDGKSGDKSGSKAGSKTESKSESKSDKSDKTDKADAASDGSLIPSAQASPVALAAAATLGDAANQQQGQNAGAGDTNTIDAARPHGQKAAIIQAGDAGNGAPASPKDATATQSATPDADATAAKAKSGTGTEAAGSATADPAGELVAAFGQGQIPAGSKRKADGQAPAAQDPDAVQTKDGGKNSASSAANATDPTKAAPNASAPGQAGQNDTSASAHGTNTDRLASDIAKSAPPHDHDGKSDDATASSSKSGADNLQAMVLPQPAGAPSLTAAAAIKVDAAAASPTAVAIPVEGLAVAIASKADSGKKSFDIRLDPPELGRIHVQLDVDHNGQIATHVIADRSDTLDLLRRDSSGLERALQDAGLKTSSNGLQFSLRDQGYGGGNQQWTAQTNTPVQNLIVSDETTAILPSTYRSFAGIRSGVDIRV